jgi:hypothetical protein
MQTCRYEIHGDQGVTVEKSYHKVMRNVQWHQYRIAPVVVGPNEILVDHYVIPTQVQTSILFK